MFDLSRLKIAFLALTLGQGGAERQLYYMLKVLREQGSNVRLLSLTRGEYWEKPIKDLGIPIFWVGQAQSRIVRLWRVIDLLRSDVPHLLQSQHLYTNLYAVGAARMLNTYEIGAVRNNGIAGIKRIDRLSGYLTLRAPRIIAANSRCAINNMVDQGIAPKHLFFLPNVVDTDNFPYVPYRHQENITLLAVGSLCQQKRFDRFLTLLHFITQGTELPIKGIIVGDGELRPQLEAQANGLGLLPHKVEFWGRLENVLPAYKQANMLVLTSDWEGTPNVVLEAMACGLPVIATAVGGVPEIVKNGDTGFVVSPNDITSMVNKIIILRQNPALASKIGQQAREFVVRNFSLERLPNLLQELYSTILCK
jgi:glycosyltransferase involved in cell wall biosynthesis